MPVKLPHIFDLPRSGVLYNFGGSCLSVPLYVYVCQTITFESLDVGNSHLNIRFSSRQYKSSSYMKVTEAKNVQNGYFHNVNFDRP